MSQPATPRRPLLCSRAAPILAVSLLVVGCGGSLTEVKLSYPDVNGVYDLTALITSSDPAWGIPHGTRQTAVLTIRHASGPQFDGTFSDFQATEPGSPPTEPRTGSVSGTVHPNGQILLELTFAGSGSSYWTGGGKLESRQIAGTYGAGGHISGTFTAQRR